MRDRRSRGIEVHQERRRQHAVGRLAQAQEAPGEPQLGVVPRQPGPDRRQAPEPDAQGQQPGPAGPVAGPPHHGADQRVADQEVGAQAPACASSSPDRAGAWTGRRRGPSGPRSRASSSRRGPRTSRPAHCGIAAGGAAFPVPASFSLWNTAVPRSPSQEVPGGADGTLRHERDDATPSRAGPIQGSPDVAHRPRPHRRGVRGASQSCIQRLLHQTITSSPGGFRSLPTP
jgi:hypothetical protein